MEIINKYFDDFNERQQYQLQQLEALYTEWNAKINVISRKDIDSLYTRHVLHSLSIAVLGGFVPGTQIVDIGTGGGFPGIPLAIFFPEVQFLLVDSINKKLNVVREVAAAIGLDNIETRHARIEDIKGRSFDFAVSRAVAPLADLWRWSKPIIRKGHDSEMANGLLCLKGGDLHQEISESMTRPSLFTLTDIFDEPEFAEKYLVYVPKK